MSDLLQKGAHCVLLALLSVPVPSGPALATNALPASAGSEKSSRLVDPTRPPRPHAKVGAPEMSRSNLVLTAILIAEGRRIAQIGSRRVHPGDVIGEARVLAIEARRVRLRDRHGSFTLELNAVDVKHAARKETANDGETTQPPAARTNDFLPASTRKKPMAETPREVGTR